MKRCASLVCLLVVIVACSPRKAPVPKSASCCTSTFAIPSNNQPASYFPAGTFLPDAIRENGLVAWYSRSLYEMAEPSFQSIIPMNVESYRFLWLRSFHPGVSIRVWKCSAGYCLTAKQLDSVDRYVDVNFTPTAKLAIKSSRSLSADEWNGLVAALDRSHFWSAPTVDGKPMANDGAEWLVEGAKESQYHVVARQSPTNGDYFDACVFLLKLSGLKVDGAKGELY